MTQLGGCVLYTRDVAAALAFYERAFGMERKFVAPENSYGEMHGSVPLGFASEALVSKSLAFEPSRPERKPAALEVVLVFADPAAAYQRAVAAGATPVQEATVKPWGQTVAYVRDPDGVLVELCTPWSPS